MQILPLVIFAATILQAADPVLPAGAKPRNLGSVGAGEGPAWDGKGTLYFTDAHRITLRDSAGQIRVFREPSNDGSGLLFDPQGRLMICEGATRRVTRIEPDGRTIVLADRYQGKRFNEPNDLTIDSKGRIYFSDPRYGKDAGKDIVDEKGRTIEGVYRVDLDGKVSRVLGREVERANGVLISADDKYMYVADNNNNNEG